MASWSHGYVSDVEYLPGFYADQAPGHLQLACLIKGVEPPLKDRSFEYCELGCGQGTTACLIAAANPQAKIVAIDFNPAHIARARRNAADYGLDNIEFVESSFDELDHFDNLFNFDIITLHGVWSWISNHDREAIVNFLKKAVKPGGLVSISYNSMPGWTSILPFQKMIFEHSNLASERSDQRVIKSLEFIEKLQKLGCQTVANEKFFGRFRSTNKMRTEQDHAVYLAHEYLNKNWEPLYHVDTVRLLESAKLNFVSSATILDNFSDLMLTPEQKELTDQFPQGPMREMIKDYFVNRPFRRDIFIRGAQHIHDKRRDELLSDFALALTVDASSAKFTINTPAGEAKLPENQYLPIFEALSLRPHTLGELTNAFKQKNIKIPSMVEIAGILVGTNQALPLPWGLKDEYNYITHKFNSKAIVPVIERENSVAAIASSLAGSGINLNAIESIVYHVALTTNNDSLIIDESLKILSASPNPIIIDGEEIHDPEMITSSLKDGIIWTVQKRIPIWRNLKMLP